MREGRSRRKSPCEHLRRLDKTAAPMAPSGRRSADHASPPYLPPPRRAETLRRNGGAEGNRWKKKIKKTEIGAFDQITGDEFSHQTVQNVTWTDSSSPAGGGGQAPAAVLRQTDGLTVRMIFAALHLDESAENDLI